MSGYDRVKLAEPTFHATLLSQLPLQLTDESVHQISVQHGWQDHFWKVPSLALAKAPPSQDIAAVIAKAGQSSPPPMAPFRAVLHVAPPAKAPQPQAVLTKAAPKPKASSKAAVPQPAPANDEAGSWNEFPAEPEDAPVDAIGQEEEDRPVCSICLDDLGQPMENVTSLECGHTFHVECIERWKRNAAPGSNMRCPLCRGPTVVPETAEDVPLPPVPEQPPAFL